MTLKYTSPIVDLSSKNSSSLLRRNNPAKATFERAYLELHGLSTVGASFVGRVFINNLTADDKTPLDSENGFVGSFSVLGHGGCGGDVGHCSSETGLRESDRRVRRQKPKTMMVLKITEALASCLASTKSLQFSIILVDVVGSREKCDLENPLHFENFSINVQYHERNGQLESRSLVGIVPAH